MDILVSNDDGVDSPGILALAEALSTLGRVIVVAPDRQRSAVAHALTIHSPIRLNKVRENWYSSNGTPTDCVHLGVHSVLNRPPDLLVAGINMGANLGDDVTYSGTVGVAMEGALLGVPSIAMSLAAKCDYNFAPAAEVARKIAELVLTNGLADRTYLNVNVPNYPVGQGPGPLVVTAQGRRIFGSGIVKKTDPRGGDYYWVGGQELGTVEGAEGTDVHAVNSGCVSVTPLQTDLTSHGFVDALRGWNLNGGVH